MKKILVFILLFIAQSNLDGQNIICSDSLKIVESKKLDLYGDKSFRKVELFSCKNEGILQVKICLYEFYNKDYKLITELIGKDLTGYQFPHIQLTEDQIKLNVEVRTKFGPGVEGAGLETSFYIKKVDSFWVYFGSISTSYNEDGKTESFGIDKHHISSDIFIHNDTIFNNIQLQKQQLELLNHYVKYLTLENVSKKYHKTNEYSELATMSFINFMLVNSNTIQKLNDIGYFLTEAKQYEQAIYLLQIIQEQFPNRTVLYLNLGDAYFGYRMQSKAKEAYNSYISLMKKSGKEAKIPKRVYERVK